MTIVQTISSALPLAFGYCCLATMIVQVGAGISLWTTGKLNKDKVVRYAAIAYGLDISKLEAEAPPGDAAQVDDHDLTHDQLLAKRVSANAILADRKVAMKQEAETIRGMEKELKSERDRRATVRKNFRSYLDELERGVVMESLGDVKRTLENLSPRQAKDIILRILEDEGMDDGDDVVKDIVTIVKQMSEAKLKKIFSEFKTPEEEDILHRILMEIGNLKSGASR